MTGSGSPRSPVPDEVATELQRVVERWRQLPLDRALSYSGQVRAFVQGLADEVAEANSITDRFDGAVGRFDGAVGRVEQASDGSEPSVGAPEREAPERVAPEFVVPDLGPATLMDQLTVMVHDASTSALATSASVTSRLAKELARLRGELR